MQQCLRHDPEPHPGSAIGKLFPSQLCLWPFLLYVRVNSLLMTNIGLLLLRASGFLLAFTFGIQKIGWYLTAFHTGKPLSSTGLAPPIAHMGFPLPMILAVWITLNESAGAFFIGIGFLTRLAAASLALGMIGALYTSVQLREDWLRAALYLITFAALIFTGPGKFSVDRLLQTRKKKPNEHRTSAHQRAVSEADSDSDRTSNL